jgi:hypothetical protein
MNFLKRFIQGLALGLFGLILLFEEWGWEPLSRVFAWLSRLRPWALMERKITALPKWGALLVFFVPTAALIPVKLLALFLFGQGHVAWGLTLLICAKLVGTALLARLFQLTLPALMQFAWFARWYPRWKAWKDGLLAQVRQSAAWRLGRLWKAEMKTLWARVWG